MNKRSILAVLMAFGITLSSFFMGASAVSADAVAAPWNRDAAASADIALRTTNTHDVQWSGSFTSTNNNSATSAPLPTDAARTEQVWRSAVGNNTILIMGEHIYTYDGVRQSDAGFDGTGTLYQINKNTGLVESKLTCPVSTSYYYSYIIYGGGLIYVGCPTAVLAIDPDSFTLLWNTTVPTNMYPTIQFVNGYIVTNGTVLNATTGKIVKTMEGTYSWASGAEVGERFYVAGSDGNIYAFNTTSWECTDLLSFGGSGAGVMYHNGWLYWGDKSSGYFYSVQIQNGDFADATLVKSNCGYNTVGAPVASGDRVYLAGYRRDDSLDGTGHGAVCVFSATDRSLIYTAQMSGVGHKVQSTPILSTASSGKVSLYLQDYAAPGSIYILEDVQGQTSGTLTKLITPECSDYAWGQLAWDQDGALYCTNDSGYLMKYRTADVQIPTFTQNLFTAEVCYGQGATADTLTVEATVSDNGVLTYRWQSKAEAGDFEDIADAIGNSYTPDTQTAGTVYYRCVVTNTLSGERATAYSKTAKITVQSKPPIPGDLDGDGEANMKDVTLLKRCLAGWNVEIRTEDADFNGDGELSMKDVTQLRRHLAGWDVTITE